MPLSWPSSSIEGIASCPFIPNPLTRLRFCESDGRLALKEKGPPGTQAKPDALPWFEHPRRASRDTRIVFGHWSTLGYTHKHNVWALDSGCLWGGALTLLRLDTPQPRMPNVRIACTDDRAS